MNNFSEDFVPLDCVLEYPSNKELKRKRKAKKRKTTKKKRKKTDEFNFVSPNYYLIEDKYLKNLFKNSINFVEREVDLGFDNWELEDLEKVCLNVMRQHIGDLYLGLLDKGKLRIELKILCRKTIKDCYNIKHNLT